MSSKQLKIEELRDLINKGECKDPLVFLESVMNGQDPREYSELYELVCEIDDFCGGEPTKSEWNEVVDFVMSRYKYRPVSLSESTSAAKTIAEYLHAKRKNIETSEVNGADGGASKPLTEEEIELFKEKFNDEF